MTAIYLRTEYVSTKNTEKKTYQQEHFTDSYQKCEEVAQETCYNRPGVAPKREQVALLFVAPWKLRQPDVMFMMIDGFPFICNHPLCGTILDGPSFLFNVLEP